MSDSSTTSRRVWIALGCVVALVIGLGMAYWQWSRYESASGTLQNLGYVLQWPLFGIFPAFMVWRIWKVAHSEIGSTRHAERADARAGDGAGGRARVEHPVSDAPSRLAYVAPTLGAATAGDLQHHDGDEALQDYNAMLARLNASGKQE